MIIDHDKDWFTRLLTFKWPLVDLFAPGQGAVSHRSTMTHSTPNDSYLMTSYDLFNQSVYPFRAFIFGFKIALILKLSVVAPFPFREHTSACPHGPWSKIGTFFESILYNATREGSILDSSLRIFYHVTFFDQSKAAICLVILGLEKRFIETLYSRVLNFLWILTEWWLISMTHCDSVWPR